MSSHVDPNVYNALSLLACKFEAEGHPLEALHCLYALLMSRMLPDQEARIRVQAGRLLLEHTTNYKEAYKEIMAAQQAAASLVGSFCLKCEIFCWLARFHQLQGQTNHQVQALRQGLQLCEAAASATERPLLLRWAAYFHAKLVSALWDSGEGLAKTRRAAGLGASFAKQHGLLDMELLFELLHLQLDLVEAQSQGSLCAAAAAAAAAGQGTGASHDLDTTIKLRFVAIDARLEQLRQRQDRQAGMGSQAGPAAAAAAVAAAAPGAPDLPAGLLPYAFVHTSLMQVLYELGRGRTDKLIMPPDEKGRRNPLLTVEHMRIILEACRSKPVGYKWLPVAEAEAAVSLCGVLLCAYYSKPEQAVEQLAMGKAAVQRSLEELQLAGPGVSEHNIDCLGLWLSRTPLVLRLQLGVCEAHLHLSSTQLSKARDAVKEVLTQVRLFPNQLRSMVAPAHLLAGQYAHAVGEWDAAAAHFQAAQQAPHAPTQLLAASFLALTLCCRPGSCPEDMEGAQAAVDALGDAYVELTSTPLGSSGAKGSEPLELVLAQVAAALIKYRMGQHQDAHRRLSLALRASHGHLVHYSLVSTCMAFLVPLLLQMGDTAAADSMVTSAHLMARGSMRTMCQLHRLLEAVSRVMPNLIRAEKAQADYHEDAAQLEAQIFEARTSDATGHAYILRFELQNSNASPL